MKPKAIICDIDGTLALRGERSPYDMTRVGEDLPNVPVLYAVAALHCYVNYPLIFTSGRDETARKDTRSWLRRYLDTFAVNDFMLVMRATGDVRPDHEVKQEMLDLRILPEYDVFCVFDDRRQVVQMWRANGLTVFDVADGDF